MEAHQLQRFQLNCLLYSAFEIRQPSFYLHALPLIQGYLLKQAYSFL
jgi:hypothetical protein